MRITNYRVVRQEDNIDEHLTFVNKLLSSDKCRLDIPPNCYLWSGTKKELEKLLDIKVQTSGPRKSPSKKSNKPKNKTKTKKQKVK